MYSKEPLIQALTHASYYDAVKAWICKNYDSKELDQVQHYHPNYKGNLLDYYIDQAAVIYVEMKNFRPDEIYYRSRSVYFEEGREYVYRPLSPLPLLGALWCIIMADTDRWDEDTVKAGLVMEQMERISACETDVLRQAILENKPLSDNRKQNAAIFVDEMECHLHPESFHQMKKYLAYSVAHPSHSYPPTNHTIPTKDNYIEVVQWLEEEKQRGTDWYKQNNNNRTAMCRQLSEHFGWVVDQNSLGKAQKRTNWQKIEKK